MARPKEFDVEEALGSAMNVFWSNGYKATSLGDLTGAMGISKSSMYETFGSKHDLFLATIEHYTRTVTTQISGAAHIDAPAVKVIRALFHRAVQRMAEPNSRRGCYLNNCAVEVSVRDSEAGDGWRTVSILWKKHSTRWSNAGSGKAISPRITIRVQWQGSLFQASMVSL